MKVDNKNFYFDIGQNNRGVYMRISEVKVLFQFSNIFTTEECCSSLNIYPFFKVKNNFRTSITIPEKCWLRFRDIFNDYCDKIKKSPDSNTADNILPPTVNSLK